MDGEHRLFAQLLYGTSMRLIEGLRLRVKDVISAITDHRAEGKGGKDRVVMLPQHLVPSLHEQMARARVLWEADRSTG